MKSAVTAAEQGRIDWDAPGVLSIVVQGGLTADNVIETAQHCRHWRQLFPAAQIVMAVSTCDLFDGEVQAGVLIDPPMAAGWRDRGVIRAAISDIVKSCDDFVLSQGALPLPPIRTAAETLNNVNLQIAAAKAGLAVATGRYVLRLRSDLVLLTRDFLRQYEDGATILRGLRSIFAERVLISPLYTLNPLLDEQMPLHFSDWFNLGLTNDVRMIWNVPEMYFADAIYYSVNRAVPGSTLEERLVLTRLTIEQHIMFHCLAPHVPELQLAFHNDRTSTDLSIDLLADNFVIADLVATQCYFRKYESEIDSMAVQQRCITRVDWLQIAVAQGADRIAVLERKRLLTVSPELKSFPRHYPARALATQIGQRNQGELVARSADGVLSHGPYDTLPAGVYLAIVRLSRLIGGGTIIVRATLNHGKEVLAERRVQADGAQLPTIVLPFEIRTERGSGVEIVVHVSGIKEIALSDLTIAHHEYTNDHATVGRQLFLAGSSWMRSTVGARQPDGVMTSGRAGYLLYGPYTPLDPGSYCASFTFSSHVRPGISSVEVVSDEGSQTLGRKRITSGDLAQGYVVCCFKVYTRQENVEFRVKVNKRAQFVVSSIELVPRSEDTTRT